MSENTDFRETVIHSLKWVAVGKISSQLFRWVMTFWVIRLLTPEDYGVVAMSEVFFGFFLFFIGSFFTPVIIQAKELSTEILKQLFGAILVVYGSAFLIQLTMAELVGDFYQSEKVASILKVNAWCFLILAFEVIPSALLAKNMKFKQVSIISAISNIIAAFATLIMAYMGYGYWSLVVGEVISITLRTIMTLVVKPIVFLPQFNFEQIKPYMKFGGLLTLHSILMYFFLHMDIAIAGRALSASEVGLFAIGLQLALMPQKKILPLIKHVAFPAFSKIQEQPNKIIDYTIKAQKLSLYITIPIFWGLASVIDNVIPLVLGEQWVGAVLPATLILLVMPLRFSEELFLPVFKSQKKIKHMLINGFILTIVMIVCFILGIRYGAVGLASAWILGFPIAYIIIIKRNARELGFAFSLFYKLLIRPFLAGMVMVVSVYLFKIFFIESNMFFLLMQIIIGGISYLGFVFLFDANIINDFRSMMKKRNKIND